LSIKVAVLSSQNRQVQNSIMGSNPRHDKARADAVKISIGPEWYFVKFPQNLTRCSPDTLVTPKLTHRRPNAFTGDPTLSNRF
jgi:hypothetical protein